MYPGTVLSGKPCFVDTVEQFFSINFCDIVSPAGGLGKNNKSFIIII